VVPLAFTTPLWGFLLGVVAILVGIVFLNL
jgi:hypothetical protein